MTEFYDNLNKEEKMIMKEQIERFNKLKKETKRVISISDRVILPKGTLIHGTFFNKDVLNSISNSGIITGQFFGIEEDGETFYCADFHKVSKDITLSEYNDSFPYNDGRCPFGKFGKNQIAFLLFPDERMNELIKYDCFDKETEEGKVARSFVNENGLPYDDKDIVSSILFGIPSNFINGIVIGDNIVNKENIDTLLELYKDTFIVRNNGQIIYKPGENEELTDIRIENVKKSIEIEKIQKEKERLEEQVQKQKDSESKLWDSISDLPLEYIEQIYKKLGWQGDLKKYAENLKKKGKKI